MRKIGTLTQGTAFTYGGLRFVVLEAMADGVFCLLEQSSTSVPFHAWDDAPLNNYAKSTLRKSIEGPWLDELLANGGSRDDMVPFDVDLRPTDQSEGYGTLEGVLAAPLTLWQYGKYKDIIPLNEEDLWWLVTPWACPRLRSPYTSNTKGAWVVGSGGGYYYYCSSSCGLRPALKLNSDLLVSVDGEEDEEVPDSNEAGKDILRGVDTLTLVREVERLLTMEVSEALCLQGRTGEEAT